MFNLDNTVQSWNLYMKSSTRVPWVTLCLSMYWLGTLRSTLALIVCGSSSSLALPQNLFLAGLQVESTRLLALVLEPCSKSLFQCIVLTIF